MQSILREPVIAADGHSYGRAALQAWLQHGNASPVSGAPLPHKRIVPNIALKQWKLESSLF